MNRFASDGDRAPLFVWGRLNVYATTAVVAAHVLTMILTTLLLSTRSLDWLEGLAFDSSVAFARGHAWQFASYAFVNAPTLWLAVNLFMFHFCGRELEQFFGRRAFWSLYAVAVLVPSVVAACYGLFSRCGMSGCWLPHFVVLAAFALSFPRTCFFFNIPSLWIAAAIFGITTLGYVADHAWMDLIALWIGVGAAWVWIKWQRGEIRFPERSVAVAPAQNTPDVDALLDKISREGLHSLTARERKQLEKAREKMMK